MKEKIESHFARRELRHTLKQEGSWVEGAGRKVRILLLPLPRRNSSPRQGRQERKSRKDALPTRTELGITIQPQYLLSEKNAGEKSENTLRPESWSAIRMNSVLIFSVGFGSN